MTLAASWLGSSVPRPTPALPISSRAGWQLRALFLAGKVLTMLLFRGILEASRHLFLSHLTHSTSGDINKWARSDGSIGESLDFT
jgi:hypothetical protein